MIVRGSPYKDPSVRKLTLLADVQRPSDGWIWNSTCRGNQNSITNPPEGTTGINDSVVSNTRPARSTE